MAEMSWQQALEGSGHIASMVKRVLGSMTALHNVLQEAHMLTQAQLSRILRLLRTIHWSPGSVLIPFHLSPPQWSLEIRLHMRAGLGFYRQP